MEQYWQQKNRREITYMVWFLLFGWKLITRKRRRKSFHNGLIKYWNFIFLMRHVQMEIYHLLYLTRIKVIACRAGFLETDLFGMNVNWIKIQLVSRFFLRIEEIDFYESAVSEIASRFSIYLQYLNFYENFKSLFLRSSEETLQNMIKWLMSFPTVPQLINWPASSVESN